MTAEPILELVAGLLAKHRLFALGRSVKKPERRLRRRRPFFGSAL